MTTPREERLLRLEVGRLRQRETRRVFDPAVYVGTPGGPRDSFVLRARDLPAVDQAVRIEVVAALLEATDASLRAAWLVRPGSAEPHDADVQWFAAAGTAFAMHDRPLEGFYVFTRYGWRDVRTGASRSWKRLRL